MERAGDWCSDGDGPGGWEDDEAEELGRGWHLKRAGGLSPSFYDFKLKSF